MSLTGSKDTDREVVQYVDDSDLFGIWSINKWFYDKVCDDNFLKRRLIEYPDIEKSMQGETIKRFFRSFVCYKSKMKNRFDFSYTAGNFREQYCLLENRMKDKNKIRDKNYLFEVTNHPSLVKHFIEKLYLNMDDALEYASARGNIEIVKWLICKGADIQEKRRSCLYIAGLNEQIDMMNYLMDKETNFPTDLIRCAATYDNLKTAKYLIEKGADIHSEDDAALRMAVEYYASFEMVELLLKAGANVQAGKNYVLKLALKRRQTEMVDLLLSFGAKVNTDDYF